MDGRFLSSCQSAKLAPTISTPSSPSSSMYSGSVPNSWTLSGYGMLDSHEVCGSWLPRAMKQGMPRRPSSDANLCLVAGVIVDSSKASPAITMKSAFSDLARSTMRPKDSKTDSVILSPMAGSRTETPLNLLPRWRSAQWTNLKCAPMALPAPWPYFNGIEGSPNKVPPRKDTQTSSASAE